MQDAIFLLLIAIFTIFVTLINSIQHEKITKKTLTISSLNLIITIILFVIYDDLIIGNDLYEEIYLYFSIYIYVYFFITFLFSFKNAILKSNHYQLFVKSIRESNWNAYYSVDRRERIKDMSQSFLDELGLEKKDVIGKKLFSVFNKTIRIQKLNDKEITNKKLEHYYNNYKKTAKVGDFEIEELIILNYEGKQVIFKLYLQPVFALGKYRGRIVVGEKKTDFDLLGVEKKLSKSEQNLESIRLRFISTLEISKEGLFTIDLDDKTIWASNALIKILNLPDNTLDLDDFRKFIHPDDLKAYLKTLSELSLSKQMYELKYRILKDGTYIWVKERGKRIFDDKFASIIMGSINPVNVRHFRASNIDILDNLLGYNELLVKMKRLVESNKYFYTTLIKLSNIPEINDKYGYEVGNMIIADYIGKMFNTFVTENGGIFRMTGLEFVILVTDPNKMDILNKGLRQNKTLLNLDVKYGSIQTTLNVHAGISISKEDGEKEEILYQAAKEALKIAKSDKVTHQGIFYKDIK